MFYPIDDDGKDIRVGDEVKFINNHKQKTIFTVVDILGDNLIAVLAPNDKSYYFKADNCVRVYEGSDARLDRAQNHKRVPPYTIDIPVGSAKFKP